MGSGRPTTASATGRWICAAAHFAGERGSQGPGTTDYQTQRQKNRGGLWVLTGASGGRRRRAGGSSARFGGGIGAVAVDRSLRGCSEAADSPGRHGWALRRWSRGQRSPEVDGGGEFLAKGLTCGGTFASNSGGDGVRSWSSGSVRVCGVEMGTQGSAGGYLMAGGDPG